MSDRQARHVVQAKDLVEGKALYQAVVEHRQRALSPFLRRLEDEAHDAVETALLGQELGRTEQHRRVAVMAAGMHDSGIAGAVWRGRLL